MKHNYVKFISVLLIVFVMFTGCNKDDTAFKPEQISGDWTGKLVLDGSGNEKTSDSTYLLNIKQKNNLLTSTLDFRQDFGIESVVNLLGKIANDSTFSMTGMTDNGTLLKIHGLLEADKTMQIAIEGLEEKPLFFLFYKKENNILKSPHSNAYKLELKLGKKGTGRSVILVHGLDDDAETWNTMLNYFRDHGIGKTNNVWVYQYKWGKHIQDNGRDMAIRVLHEQENGDMSQDPIIIAHSMGGLVARSCIAKGSPTKFDIKFHSLVTLSTPHLGSRLADFIGLSNDGVRDLMPGSKFLKALNSDSYEQSQRGKYWLLNGRIGTYPSCKKCAGCCSMKKCIYTCYHWHDPQPTRIEKIGHGELGKPNDGMVTNASARFNGDNRGEAIISTFEWIDHKNMNRDPRICKWVTNFIKNNQ